jgi:hypothetical protein
MAWKFASNVMSTESVSKTCAAIQTSFVGMGLPDFRKPSFTWPNILAVS